VLRGADLPHEEELLVEVLGTLEVVKYAADVLLAVVLLAVVYTIHVLGAADVPLVIVGDLVVIEGG
jgi:hypothetical protein